MRPKPCRLALQARWRVAQKLALQWSPQQISGWLKQRRVAAVIRKMPRITNPRRDKPIMILRTGDVVAARPLDFYQAVGRRLAYQGDQP